MGGALVQSMMTIDVGSAVWFGQGYTNKIEFNCIERILLIPTIKKKNQKKQQFGLLLFFFKPPFEILLPFHQNLDQNHSETAQHAKKHCLFKNFKKKLFLGVLAL